ncbi:MAG: tRNA-uridine aminocarboxypropyltransferase [Pirellulales bacterium]
MPRSVVLAGSARCPGCRLPPRWCVCHALPPVTTTLDIDVLIHRQERYKPSSTGMLIGRAVPTATCHGYDRSADLEACLGGIPRAGRELWILHPRGAAFPAVDPTAGPRSLQILLLDGNWRQAGEMQRAVDGLGRCVRLPETGPSRFWLRRQHQGGHVSTAEALIGVLGGVGDRAAAEGLRLHFELHVYATLLSRGRRQAAAEYLRESPLPTAIPEVVGGIQSED